MQGTFPSPSRFCGGAGNRNLLPILAKDGRDLRSPPYKMMIQQTCQTCNKPFEAREADVKRGRGRYCSLSCSSSRPRPPKEANCSCDYCGEQFYRPPSKIRSKYTFCNRSCKERAQSLDTEGFRDMVPSHYGTREATYREVAFRHQERRCNRCGYDEHPEVLEVHHIDRNRKNNTSQNLEVLCPTCHRVEHFLANDGSFAGGS